VTGRGSPKTFRGKKKTPSSADKDHGAGGRFQTKKLTGVAEEGSFDLAPNGRGGDQKGEMPGE